ncbi:MAG: hypothetical protein GW913_00190 [Myxococcales bacterium]|nr:hypothetical protein [Myxococcales bacterium]
MRAIMLLLFSLALAAPGSAQSSCVSLTHGYVGYGSVGPAGGMAVVPGWVVGTLRMRTSCEVHGLTLVRVDLLDAAGQRVGTASTELELRVSPPTRAVRDLMQQGTEPTPPVMSAGERVLWIHARIEGDVDQLTRRAPVRYRAHLRASDGTSFVVEGALDGPWPTA